MCFLHFEKMSANIFENRILGEATSGWTLLRKIHKCRVSTAGQVQVCARDHFWNTLPEGPAETITSGKGKLCNWRSWCGYPSRIKLLWLFLNIGVSKTQSENPFVQASLSWGHSMGLGLTGCDGEWRDHHRMVTRRQVRAPKGLPMTMAVCYRPWTWGARDKPRAHIAVWLWRCILNFISF